jgi:hypothetical protein
MDRDDQLVRTRHAQRLACDVFDRGAVASKLFGADAQTGIVRAKRGDVSRKIVRFGARSQQRWNAAVAPDASEQHADAE